MSHRVGVIGGGLAGITAALRCADDGAEVTLLEAKPKLGGLTHSFRRGNLDVDNGQHVFLRCCTAYRALLDRLGVSDLVNLQDSLDIAVRRPGQHRTARLTRNNLPAPLHLAGSLLRYRALAPADRLRAARSVTGLRAVDLTDPRVDDVNFGSWLAGHGQNERTVAALWDLFTIATLNVRAEEASLAMAAKVFQTGLFTSATAGDIGWSAVPLSQLHGEAAHRALLAAGADVRTRSGVADLRRDDASWVITERGGARHTVDQVVLAVPPPQAERLLPEAALGLRPGWAERLGSSPIVNVHLIFDRVVLDEPFLAGIDTPVQWVFDRTRQSGLSAGQYLAVSLSAADDTIDQPTAEIRDLIQPALRALLPRARRACLVDFFVTRERHATFRPGPGSGRDRPGSATRSPGLALAGAWTATGWPATMESAVLSGEAAAALLRDPTFRLQKGPVAA